MSYMESLKDRKKTMKEKIEIILGDITSVPVECIIYPANTELEMSEDMGKILAIKAGDSVQDQCNRIGKVKLGEAVITDAGSLQVNSIIHAAIKAPVEPVAEEDIVMVAMRNALELAKQKQIKTVAIPVFGTGSAMLPIKRSVELMLAELKKHLDAGSSLEKIIFVAEDRKIWTAFEEGYKQI